MSFKSFTIMTDRSVQQTRHKTKPSFHEIKNMLGGPVSLITGFTEYNGLRKGVAYCRWDGISQGLPINAEATKAWRKQIPGHNLRGPVLILFGEQK